MMMSKHTPGPWIAETFDVPYVRSVTTGEQILEAVLCKPDEDEPYATQDPDEAMKNIVLAAAALDLLEALQEFLELSEIAGDDDHSAYAPTMAKARAAIAKAGFT